MPPSESQKRAKKNYDATVPRVRISPELYEVLKLYCGKEGMVAYSRKIAQIIEDIESK